MANIKSQIKRNRQSQKKAVANKNLESKVKTLTKKARTTKTAGDVKIAKKHIDKAGSSRVYHPNKVARLKSKLDKQNKNKK